MANKPTDFMDLALVKNQHMIAVLISGILTITELEQLFALKSVVIQKSIQKRDVNDQAIVLMNQEFPDNRVVKLMDICILNANPISRFINLRIVNGSMYQMDFKFKFSKNLVSYLILTIATAINFSNLKDKYDSNINNSHIIQNFSKILSKTLDQKGLGELHFVSSYFNNDKNIIESDKNEYECNINGVSIRLITEYELLRFEFIKNGVINYILLPKNKIGISTICLIIEKAIKDKSNQIGF